MGIDDVHANPELPFKEHRASAGLADELERGGLRVERGIGGLMTAFRATLDGGEPGLTLDILAEYAGDAAVLDGATTLAMTAAELPAQPWLIAEARADFGRQLEANEVAGRETWLARGREYTRAGTAAE